MGKFLMNVPTQMEGSGYGSGIIALTWKVRPWWSTRVASVPL